MQLIPHTEQSALSRDHVLTLANDADPMQQALQDVQTIELHFPKFTDGRAFSQALMLRRRCSFSGDIRATGDVLIDQLSQMQRCGFSSAVLRADQDIAKGRELLKHFSAFYQGDVTQPQPLFAR
ncbi:MAG: hypothetical protein RIR92_1852 [Pseudomonadota bacterium]|jgi:uncharacterized protein (DUF934 family)